MRFEIKFSGHKNIRSNHKKTIEITKDSELTPKGDCIIGVNATCSCSDLPIAVKKKLQNPKTKVQFLIKVGKHEVTVNGSGHNGLSLAHSEDMVLRKSEFVCPRTLAVKCDKTSDLLPREMITLLQDPTSRGIFTIIIE